MVSIGYFLFSLSPREVAGRNECLELMKVLGEWLGDDERWKKFKLEGQWPVVVVVICTTCHSMSVTFS